MLGRWLALLLAILPPVFLGVASWRALLARADSHLVEIQPIAVQAAQEVLQRPVSVEAVRIGDAPLTLTRVREMLARPERFASLPVTLEGLTLGLSADESELARLLEHPPNALARVRRARLIVSLPALLGGRVSTDGVARIELEQPEALLLRLKDGSFPIQNILPKKEPPDYTKPPFQTLISVRSGRLRFLDLAAKNGERVADNSLEEINGYADLLGTRHLRFAMTGRADRKTPTAQRVIGALALSGSAPRGPPGARPDSPDPRAPRFVVALDLAGADAAYWLPYFLPLEALTIPRGRADLRFTSVGPRGASFEGPHPPPILQARARFDGATLRVSALPKLALTGWSGSLTFDDDRLSVAATGTVLGAPAAVRGTLGNLRRDLGQETPFVDAVLDAPALPVRAALAALELAPPKEATLPATLAVSQLALKGPLTAPQASGRVSAPRAAWGDWPEASDISARLTFSGDTLRLDDLVATLAGGGTLSGRVQLQPKAKKSWFVGEARGVALRSFPPVRRLKKPWTLDGRARAEVIGSSEGNRFQLAANVFGEGVRAAGVPVKSVSGRVELDESGADLKSLRLVSPKGSLVGEGRLEKDGSLGLNLTAAGVDAGWLAARLGRPGVSGRLAGRLALVGLPSDPTLRLSEVIGLNLRAAVEERRFAVDLARCAALTLRPARGTLSLDAPLDLERFPGSMRVRGGLSRLNSSDPSLALTASARDLELDEVLRQALPPVKSGQAPLGGKVQALLEGGQVRVGGTIQKPLVEGVVEAGRILIDSFPVESGKATFRYEAGTLVVRRASLLASIGELEGGLRLDRTGRLTGRFEAPELNLEALSYLTEDFASLAGRVGASLTLSGTAQEPQVTATILPGSYAEVAGAHLTGIAGTMRAEVDTATERVVLVAPQLAFRQEGAQVTLTQARLEPGTKRFSLGVRIADGQVEPLLTALRRSRIDETEAGRAFIETLNQLPAPLDGRFALTGNLSGRIADGVLLDGAGAATFSADAVTLGPASIRSIAAAVSLKGRDVTISKLELVRDEATVDLPRPGKLTLPAVAGAPLAFDLTFDSPETNLDLVRAFLPRFSLLGKVGLTVRLFGDSRAPRVTASLEGQSLALALSGEREFPLSRLSFIVNARREADGRGVLEIDSGRIEHSVLDPTDRTKIVREDAVSFDAALPLETVRVAGRETVRVAGDGALRVKASVDKLGLDTLSEALGGSVRASGALTGEVSAGGTLSAPSLGGQLALTATEVRLPRDPTGGDVLNPITAARLGIALEGSTIRVTEGTLALGPPAAKQTRESFGAVGLKGTVRLDNLAELPALLAEDPEAAIGRVAGEWDLTASFVGFRPVARNLSALMLAEAPLGLGEAVTGRLSGEVRITGKELLAPRISTEKAPLQLSQALLLLPVREGPPPSQVRERPLFNPTLDVTVEIPTDATVANQSRLFFFDFKSQGELRITGDTFQPEVLAELTPTGGRVRYPLAPPFKVKKQGSIELTYGNRTPRLSVSDLEAEGTVTVRPDTLALATSRIRDSGSFLNSTALPTGAGSRYKITLAFDGPLDVFGTASSGPGSLLRVGSGLTATADPPLPGGTEQILRILGADSQLRQLASGDAQGAILSTLEQVSSNVVLTNLLDPFNKFISDAFGLSDFNINYFPDGTAIVQASVAFRAPLERFSANLTQTLQVRARQGQRVPALLSLTYDIKSFGGRAGKKARYVPRLQAGVSNDEQRLVRYFLRGTVSY